MSNEHGLEPTPQISAADNAGTPQGQAPAAGGQAPGSTPPGSTPPALDPTQGGRTLPIGGADGVAAEIYKPDGLAQHLIGQNDRETIDRLKDAYTGARNEIAKGKPAIPAAAEYKFDWSDAVKGQGGIAGDDAAVKAFAEIAHEHGYNQQQIDAIPKFFDKLVERGMIEKPFDSAKHLEDLAPAEFRGSPLEKQQKGGARLTQAEAWIKQLDPTAHGFDDQMKQELRLLTTSLPGIRVVEQLMRGGMNASVSPGGGHPTGGVSKADLEARTADPRNDSTRHDKYDPSFAEETRRLFKQVYPD